MQSFQNNVQNTRNAFRNFAAPSGAKTNERISAKPPVLLYLAPRNLEPNQNITKKVLKKILDVNQREKSAKIRQNHGRSF